jgi:hypothetical protein
LSFGAKWILSSGPQAKRNALYRTQIDNMSAVWRHNMLMTDKRAKQNYRVYILADVPKLGTRSNKKYL